MDESGRLRFQTPVETLGQTQDRLLSHAKAQFTKFVILAKAGIRLQL